MVAGKPLWLAAPSRFAGMPQKRARWLSVLIVALLLGALTALAMPRTAAGSADAGIAELFNGSIVDALRNGGDYYSVTADALRSGGYALTPFLAFRLPTLAVVQAWLDPVVTALLLYGLAIAALYAWWKRLGEAFRHALPRTIAMLLAAVGMAGALLAEQVAVHEVWAGVLIALSLAARRPGRVTTAAAFGLAAMLIHELAALYVAVMATIALIEGRRGEAVGWASTLLILAAVLAVHAHAVADVVRPLDQATQGWVGMLGFGFAIRAMIVVTAFAWLPAAIAALLAGLALVGWSAWRDPLATRVVAILAAYLLLLSFAGQVDSTYWAFLSAPLLPIGLAFVPDAARDLTRAMLDKRRITVTRVMR